MAVCGSAPPVGHAATRMLDWGVGSDREARIQNRHRNALAHCTAALGTVPPYYITVRDYIFLIGEGFPPNVSGADLLAIVR